MDNSKDSLSSTRLPVEPVKDTSKDVSQDIKELLESEPFGILCTQGDCQPYGSIITFACSKDFTKAVFATPVNTRKYHLLKGCDRVALVVDNRSKYPYDITKINALTITGRASIIENYSHKQEYSQILVEKHPYLKEFVESTTSATILIEDLCYIYVTRFQEIHEWKP
jgi:nitroimidazol reductase NimA-like FMN-containing flavoprotein (pyridoxamine 5'-phosphate oxidase superfamily)